MASNSEIKKMLFAKAAAILGEALTSNQKNELWFNYTDTGCVESDIEDALNRCNLA